MSGNEPTVTDVGLILVQLINWAYAACIGSDDDL